MKESLSKGKPQHYHTLIIYQILFLYEVGRLSICTMDMCVVESDVCHVVTNRFGVLDTYWFAKGKIFLRVFHSDNAESFWVKKVRDNFILRCARKDRAEPLLILQTTLPKHRTRNITSVIGPRVGFLIF